MFKKLVKGIVIGGAALTLSMTAAQAGKIEVNIYGASAQYSYWTKTAPNFLNNGLKCDQEDVYSAAKKSLSKNGFSKRDAGIAVCAGDVAVAGLTGDGIGGEGVTGTGNAGSTVVIRYTTNASYDGVRAVMGDDRFGDEDSCGDYNLRGQADANAADLVAFPGAGTNITSLSCQDVHVGASDVSAKTFNQYSYGMSNGNAGGTEMEMDIKYPDALADPETDATGYQVDRPIVVPFGFFRSTLGTPVPFTNMSRLMATSIFSGQVRNWNEFGSATDLPVVVCLRHAGSGTAATLDAAVMRGDFGLLSEEVNATSSAYTDGISPLVWFNKGTSEELACVASQEGAVGYADADKTGANIALMTYQGVTPSNSTIKNGEYDFWSAQYLYSKETGATDSIIDALVAFASDEANMDATQLLFWAAQDAMKWEKSTDFAYPSRKSSN